MARVECYVSDETKIKLSNIASKKGLSTSKLINNILDDHINYGSSKSKFELRIKYTLSQILGSVYDNKIAAANKDNVKTLLKAIDDQVEKDMQDN